MARPKAEKDDKKVNTKKRKSKKDQNSEPNQNTTPKPKKTRKTCVEKIAMSKQLSEKLASKSRTRSNSKSTQPRVCPNGKPMPSLAELERMFDDSDGDEETPSTSTAPHDRCKTPEVPICISEEKLTSPTTLKVLSEKVMEIISKNILPDDAPPPPVVPPKKRKKPDQPYIVGCKDRHQIANWRSSVAIGTSFEKFGIEEPKTNTDSEDDCPVKRSKRSANGQSISKSIFNPKSEEIAAMWKKYENVDLQSDNSGDSNKTVTYCTSPSPNTKLRSFSPLPSTSKDNDTFIQNDMRYHESLMEDNSVTNVPENDVEVIDVPCETIIVDDEIPNTNSNEQGPKSDIIEIKHSPPPPSPDVFEDDMYSSIIIDVDQTYNDTDCEIIDVDDVIAENKSIIEKYKKSNDDVVTLVEPNTTKIEKVDTSESKDCTVTNTKRNSIEGIVTDFFRNQKPKGVGNSCSAINSKPIETIDLSNSADQNLFKGVINTVVALAQSIGNAFLQRQNGNVIDTIELDDSTRLDDSVSVVPTSISDNSLSVQNMPPDNSVILVNSVLDDNVHTNNITPQKRGRPKKTRAVAASSAPPQPASPNTPVRNIGDCPICMENLSNRTVASTICGHIFCMPCIQAATKTGGKKCPTCRKALRGAGFHQLFL